MSINQIETMDIARTRLTVHLATFLGSGVAWLQVTVIDFQVLCNMESDLI